MTRARSVANRGWQATRKNLLINGGMQVWQRGASGAVPLNAFTYTADRWCAAPITAGLTWAQAASPVNPSVADGALNLVGAAGNTGVTVRQRIEAANASRTYSKKLTVSGWINVTGASRAVTAILSIPSAKDDFTAVAQLTSVALGTLTAGWTKFTATFPVAMPDTVARGLEFELSSGALVAGQALAIADVQLEVGEEATDFEILPIGETQTLCERYYQFVPFSMGFNATVANQTMMQGVPYRTRMRAIPVGGPLVVDPETTPSAALNGSNVFVGQTTTHIRTSLTSNGVGYCTVGGYGSWLSAEL